MKTACVAYQTTSLELGCSTFELLCLGAELRAGQMSELRSHVPDGPAPVPLPPFQSAHQCQRNELYLHELILFQVLPNALQALFLVFRAHKTVHDRVRMLQEVEQEMSTQETGRACASESTQGINMGAYL